ncbi:MAG: hypothetical protein ACKOXF_05480 [Chitinophagaceae bacterium]
MKNFDKALKEALEKKQLNYTEEQWSSMEKLLESSNNKKGYFLLKIVLTGILLVGVSAVVLTNFNKEQENTIALSAIQNQSSSDLQSENQAEQSLAQETSAQETMSSLPLSSSSEKDFKNISKKPAIKRSPMRNVQAIIVPLTAELFASDNLPEDGLLKSMRLKGAYAISQSVILESLSLLELRKDTTFKPKLKPKNQDREVKLSYALLPFLSYNTFYVVKDESFDQKFKDSTDIKNQVCGGMYIKFSKGKVSLLTGIQCLRLSETSDYINNVRQTDYDTIRQRVVDLNYSRSRLNNPVYRVETFIDSSGFYTYQMTYKNETPKLFYLGIPVNIQYTNTHKKLGIYAEAGILTQVLIAKSGRFLDIDKAYSNVVTTGPKRMVYSAQIGLGCNYPVTEKVKIFGAINHISNISSLMNSYDYRLGSNRISIGIEYLIR